MSTAAAPSGRVPTRPYDLVRELAMALLGTLVLGLVLAAVLSSPDVPSVTIQAWAQKQPVDLVTTATGELAGTTVSAGYGAPYNDSSNAVQSLGFFSPQAWASVRLSVDPAQDFVLKPLEAASAGNANLAAALSEYNGASDSQRGAWLTAYSKALQDAKEQDGKVVVADGDYGPLPVMMAALLQIARAGALDGYLLSNGGFYQTDYTRPLLFMGDGSYLSSLASDQHLLGSQWGMMNETGSYPGQTWLWLYTLWYQIPPYSGNANADLMVVLTMLVLSAALVLVPFIPGVRDIPRWVPVHRLIWRDYYDGVHRAERARPAGGVTGPSVTSGR
ncbi:MAG TPA: hypothetical protein VKF59_05725 [Candidatus Dormibacteraeota bacterium]|nr:hypothetical protein [Candidatus Dormibacteraeota bacterium]